MAGNTSWFDELENRGIHLTAEQRKKIEEKVNSVLSYEPKVGIFGKTGVGKSSLCNALFGQDVCPISDIEACTRNPQEVILNMGNKGIKLLDVPGVGETTARDEEYAQLYAKLLPELDLVLWLIKGDDRALATDETFYKNLMTSHINQGKPFFFVINQVDRIMPYDEWDSTKNKPGARQYQNIGRKVDVVADQFHVPASKVIPVSAYKKYNLTKLVDEIVFALPKEKNVTLFKAVDDKFKSEAASEHVKKSIIEVVVDAVRDVADSVADAVSTVVDFGRDVMDWIDRHTPSWWPFK